MTEQQGSIRLVSDDGRWMVTLQRGEWVIDGPHDGDGMVWWTTPDTGQSAEQVLADWEAEHDG